MASWLIHLRIADKLLDEIPGLSPTEFVVGNIAPDSGVPNEDWTSFTPSTTVSHYRKDSGEKTGKNIDIAAYVGEYSPWSSRWATIPGSSASIWVI